MLDSGSSFGATPLAPVSPRLDVTSPLGWQPPPLAPEFAGGRLEPLPLAPAALPAQPPTTARPSTESQAPSSIDPAAYMTDQAALLSQAMATQDVAAVEAWPPSGFYRELPQAVSIVSTTPGFWASIGTAKSTAGELYRTALIVLYKSNSGGGTSVWEAEVRFQINTSTGQIIPISFADATKTFNWWGTFFKEGKLYLPDAAFNKLASAAANWAAPLKKQGYDAVRWYAAKGMFWAVDEMIAAYQAMYFAHTRGLEIEARNKFYAGDGSAIDVLKHLHLAALWASTDPVLSKLVAALPSNPQRINTAAGIVALYEAKLVFDLVATVPSMPNWAGTSLPYTVAAIVRGYVELNCGFLSRPATDPLRRKLGEMFVAARNAAGGFASWFTNAWNSAYPFHTHPTRRNLAEFIDPTFGARRGSAGARLVEHLIRSQLFALASGKLNADLDKVVPRDWVAQQARRLADLLEMNGVAFQMRPSGDQNARIPIMTEGEIYHYLRNPTQLHRNNREALLAQRLAALRAANPEIEDTLDAAAILDMIEELGFGRLLTGQDRAPLLPGATQNGWRTLASNHRAKLQREKTMTTEPTVTALARSRKRSPPPPGASAANCERLGNNFLTFCFNINVK